MTTRLPPQIEDFITQLRTAGRDGTAKGYAFHLGHVADWLASQQLTPLTVTTNTSDRIMMPCSPVSDGSPASSPQIVAD